ncbi:hypothetical protein AMECASPLE_001681 [Ameca splendens]|uniref:Uncharacterized protein n=1 Tax=Ameca splendens TaxID=208324 RepID=A0ABV0YL46_9TELE
MRSKEDALFVHRCLAEVPEEPPLPSSQTPGTSLLNKHPSSLRGLKTLFGSIRKQCVFTSEFQRVNADCDKNMPSILNGVENPALVL